jgi:putative ABC transport system substrate-binding protein
MGDIRRREFITLLGSAATWPAVARAQQAGRPRRVALLIPYAEVDPGAQARVAAIQEGLNELGWSEGRNLELHFRWTTNSPERLRADAAELAGLGPDVIVAPSTIATAEARRATSTIPIVFVNVLDPIGSGFVASLARPGGNITGFATFEPSIGGKWLELLTELAPGIKRVALLATSTSMATAGLLSHTIEATASAFPALKLIRAPVQDIAEMESVIAAHGRTPDTGLIVLPEPFTTIHYKAIAALAAQHRLPAVYPYRFFAVGGGMLSYGVDLVSQYRQAAAYIDRILKGAKPADLPVQLPTKFELVVNLKAAAALGLVISPTLLARADEVIE